MNSTQIEAQHLLRFIESDTDRDILQGLLDYGTQKALCRATDHKRRTVQRRLAKMRKHAERFGFNREFPEASTVMADPIKGQSRLIKHDPPLPDGTILQWNKTSSQESSILEAFEAISDRLTIPAISAKEFKVPGSGVTNELVMLVLADCHLGLLAREGWGLDENLTLCKDLVRRHVAQMQPVEEALLMNVGDLTHTDGLVAQTAKNRNPLDVNALYYDICGAGVELIIFAIEALRTKARKVTYAGVPGNHDYVTTYHITERIGERYRAEPRVNILDSRQSVIPYVWEKNFILGWHGDTAPNSRAHEWVHSTYPRECGMAEHIHLAKGHIHHTRKEYVGRMCCETYTSSTKTDAYHDFRLFRAKRGMTRVHFDPEGFEAAEVTLRPQRGN